VGRYVVLWAEGGVYADLDVACRHAVCRWLGVADGNVTLVGALEASARPGSAGLSAMISG
jgi:mannosyltransferase OCH1-like enzyme